MAFVLMAMVMEVKEVPNRLLKFVAKKYLYHLKHQPFGVLLNTVAAIAFAIFFILWLNQNQAIKSNAQTAKTLAANTRNLTQENARLLIKVQNQRRDLLYRGCRDQNSRHDDSLVALKKLLKKSGVSQARRTAAYQQTKVLIDALVPKYNCVKLANRFVKPNKKPIVK